MWTTEDYFCRKMVCRFLLDYIAIILFLKEFISFYKLHIECLTFWILPLPVLIYFFIYSEHLISNSNPVLLQ